MLQGRNDSRMRHEQEFPVVGEAVQERLDTPVHVVEVFSAREPEPAEVVHPGVHLFAWDRSELLPFPGTEVYFDDGFVLFDFEPRYLGRLFGKAVGPEERAREKSGGFGSCFLESIQRPGGFAFECRLNVKVQSTVADVVGIVGLSVADCPEDHIGT